MIVLSPRSKLTVVTQEAKDRLPVTSKGAIPAFGDNQTLHVGVSY